MNLRSLPWKRRSRLGWGKRRIWRGIRKKALEDKVIEQRQAMSVSKKKVEDLANDMETKLKDADTIARRLKEDMFKRQESQDKPKSNIYEVEVVKVLLAKACMKAYFEVFMMAMQQ